ncbi:bZIP transcription factor 44-like [Silene latifolia]|uniref:bZIP transcription factor 44-like n=1 Tax=Silene latifolia TaxID=37657 RepID=UPI003D786117
MASPGGTSSGSSFLQQNSSSEEEMQMQVMDERKRKRMQSNRESARRSRMRKQKHLDDLMAQIGNLRKSNNQILNSINVTTQEFLKFEAENCILRAQMTELSNRLQSLNEINTVLNSSANHNHGYNHNQGMGMYAGGCDYGDELFTVHDNSFLMNPWDSAASCMNQPIMASADMFQY